MTVEVRGLTEPDMEAFQTRIENAFGGDLDADEAACWRPLVEIDRAHAAWDGDQLVGSGGVFTFDMTAPGGPVPTAGVTMISVAPTHRRQGVLTEIMRRQLDDVRERGVEPIASLWASEAVIYGRFGYGVAGRRWHVRVGASEPALLGAAPVGRVRSVTADELRAAAPAVYDAVRVARPGMISRSPERWTTHLADLPAHRHGASTQRCVVYERDGEVRGYAMFRVKGEWAKGVPNGEVRVKEVQSLDADAHAGLWRFLLAVDLMRATVADNLPPDDPIHDRLHDPRVVSVHITDGLYVRVVDVEAALSRRSYSAPARVVVEVVDPFGGYAAGRWLVDASPSGCAVKATTESADLTLSAAELGGVYLGDTTLRALFAAGRVDEHRPGSVVAASAAFAWPVRAWCPEIF
jgi:predicted acetyltransferase